MLLVACEPAPATRSPVHDTELAPLAPSAPAQDIDWQQLVRLAEQIAPLQLVQDAQSQARAAEKRLRSYLDALHWQNPQLRLLGSRSGYPAFSISDAEHRKLLIVSERHLLEGSEGFWTICDELSASPLRIASAYLLLIEAQAKEPSGPWSSPPEEPPRWLNPGRSLSLHFTDETGQNKRLLLELDCATRFLKSTPLATPR